MQKSLFDPEVIDDLDKQAENKNKKTCSKEDVFSSHTMSVFDQHQAFLEQKKRVVEEHKKWKKNRK